MTLTFKSIIKKAVDQNIDVDRKGNLNGHEFAAKQVLRDLEKYGYYLRTPGGEKVSVTLRKPLDV